MENFSQKMDMPVFASKRVLSQIQLEFSYVFSDKKYPGVPQIEAKEITEAPATITAKEIEG